MNPTIASQSSRRIAALLFCLALLPALAASTRADAPAFETYTQRDGLAADFVNQVAFGCDASIWLATSRGATQVRDKYWVSYTAAHGLGNSWVNGVACAGDNKIWFATSGGGLALFSGANRKTYTTSNSAIPSNYLTGLAIDKQGRVWVGTYGAGVARLDNEQWTKYPLPNNYINALAFDAAGNLWVATSDGAFFFDGKTWVRVAQANGLASNRINSITIAPSGGVWFATDSGATVFDGKTYRTYKKSDGLVHDIVRTIAVDAQSRAWFGTAHGLSLLEAGKWKTYTRADGLAADEINSITLDFRGTAWVGTSHGLSVSASGALQRAATWPVVLVHGWHTADSDKLDDTEFRFIRKYLERDGFSVFYAEGISPYKTLFQNAATLRDVIAAVKTKTGAPRVDLIAFSMGGLNTRAYLESSFYQNDVRRAIILGTPQAGVRLWYPLLTREIEDRPTEPSVIELTPEYATLFNRTHAPRATVPYDLLVGDARTQTGLDLLKGFSPSDGLIDVWSAHALVGPQVRHVTNTDLHAWNPEALPISPTSYLYPEQTYARFIRNGLRDPDARPISFAATPVEPTGPRNTTPLNVDPLRANETITRTIPVDANRAARFLARWDGGDVEIKLRAPDGSRYAPDSVRDATYLKTNMADFAGYTIPRAQAGAWSVIATRLDKGTVPITLTTYADLDADLKMDIGSNQTIYSLGSPVVLTTTLSNRVSNVEVRARVQWLGDGSTPRGAPSEVSLLPEIRPGSFTVTLTDLTRGGYYLARITVRGTGYARERQLIFAVSPKTAAFAGNTRARTQPDALVIETDVNVARAGEFAIGATLTSPKGQLVASITTPLTLSAGTQTVSVAIPGRDIRASGIDGPYTVELVLMDAAWAALQVDELTKAMTTSAIRAIDFGE